MTHPGPGALWRFRQATTCLALLFAFVVVRHLAWSQAGGQGAIQGTVTDPTGSVIANATVTALDLATHVKTSRTSSSEGLYQISPLLPGNYTVTVKAAGFQLYTQENLVVDAMHVTSLNIRMSVGTAAEEITVTSAPPALDTTNSTLGGIMENKTYESLPVLMSGQQRDPTAFATLMPGAQPGARTPVISGTSNYLAEVYLEGIPLTTASQQGDNRDIFNSVPVDAVDQLQLLTSSMPAEYQGAGLLNFTIKSGGDKYHGTVFDYMRNTMFDTWGFTAPGATQKNAAGQTIPAPKPDEHQNEFGFTLGGPAPFLHKKLFLFGAYDRYHGRAGVHPNTLTVPTLKMRDGDFSELLAANGGPGFAVYDPTTQASCTAHSTTGPCRYQFGYGPGASNGPAGNPTLTGAPINVIPSAEVSPIAKYMEQFLPAPSNSSLTGNYLGGVPSGFDNWEYVIRGDYDLTDKQRISAVTTNGNRLNVPYTIGNNGIVLPIPYVNGSKADIAVHVADLEHSYVITPHLVNQAKFGFVNFGGPPVTNATQGVKQYEALSAGITNLPPGQASEEFPGASFSGGDAQSTWTANGASGATYTSVSDTYTAIDNLQWVKGRHSMTFGFQYQWLDDNASAYDGPSGVVPINYSTNETANLSGSAYISNTGYSYASYMLGAVGSSSLTIQSFSVLGGRYHPFAPYFQDDYQVTPKLTVNLGLRWDYMPPYHEVLDRFSFLNPKLTNPATGTMGALEFAGHRGAGVSCQCSTPVSTYHDNWGPRLGFAYSINDKTVVRGGFGVFFSHAGGVGGRAGAATGTGQLGFSVSPSFTDSTAGPAFYLNNSSYFSSIGLANTDFGGPGYALPAPLGPTSAAQSLNAGNYVSNGKYVAASSGPSYADPYISGRAPTFNFYNLGIQRSITRDLTLAVNYAGSQSHFIVPSSSNIRGYWSNQLNPSYLVLGSLLAKPATAANVAAAQAILPGISAPAGFEAAAALSPKATIAQMLIAFPQYTSVSDIWGQNSANASYNSLQVTAEQRLSHGLSMTLNYTYAKQLDDAGTFRSGFAIPGTALATGKSWKADRIERSLSALDQPQGLSAYGVYELPFGKNGIGANNFFVRNLAGGWQLSGIFTYRSGTPLAITSGNCTSSSLPGQGQCMPDYNPSFHGSARFNGSWAKGTTWANLGTASDSKINGYVNPSVSQQTGAFQNSAPYMLGDVARTRALNLWNPSAYNLDVSVRRTFELVEGMKFIFEADVTDVTNKVTFGGISTNVNSSNFGAPTTASGNRDWQFAGRINF